MASTPQSLGRVAAARRRKAETSAALAKGIASASKLQEQHAAARHDLVSAASRICPTIARQLVAGATEIGPDGAKAVLAALQLSMAGR